MTPGGEVRPRTLVLHIGAPKTGSSALQLSFVRNRHTLAQQGIAYPEHESDQKVQHGVATSGNGQDYHLFLSGQQSEEQEQRFLHSVAAELARPDVEQILISSELVFTALRLEQLRVLNETTTRAGGSLRVVVYVRNIAGHAMSAYSQAVKRGLYTGTLHDYLHGTSGERYHPRYRQVLGPLLEELGPDALKVFHYDSNRGAIFRTFLNDALSIKDLDPFDLSPGEVNRSLTPHEIAMMRYMNRTLTTRPQARKINDALISLPPFGAPGQGLTDDDMDLLHQRFDGEVDWVNATFFHEPLLRVGQAGRATGTATAEEPSLTDVERHLLDCLVAISRPPPKPPQASTRPQKPPARTGATPSTPGSGERAPTERAPRRRTVVRNASLGWIDTLIARRARALMRRRLQDDPTLPHHTCAAMDQLRQDIRAHHARRRRRQQPGR